MNKIETNTDYLYILENKQSNMSQVKKQTLRDTYNIIYSVDINDVCNTTLRDRINTYKTKSKLRELDTKIREWTNAIPTRHFGEECPICYNPFEQTNYILPKCGHKVCLDCFKKCILSKNTNTNECCMCKQCIL